MNHSQFDVSKDAFDLALDFAELAEVWGRIDRLVFVNQARVLKGFGDARISFPTCGLPPGTDNGCGREGLERLFAKVFGGRGPWCALPDGRHHVPRQPLRALAPGRYALSVTERLRNLAR